MNKRVLIAGESWVKHISHIKGFDIFTSCEYETGITWLKEALEKHGFEVVHLPGHEVADGFPFTAKELAAYGAVALSDIGANSLLLSGDTFNRSKVMPNRLEVVREYVEQGGGFAMIGGYLSFAGIDGKARYADTAVDEILPVKIMNFDDRVEKPEGITPVTTEEGHPMMQGIGAWPHFLGYNRTTLRPEGRLLASAGKDPFVAVRLVGKGRTAAFASDCAPHWGPQEFVEWANYPLFWSRFFGWLCGE